MAESLDTRSRLLICVGEILDEQGMAGLSLRKVCQRAGVSHAAPAALFGDRAAMLTAYAAHGFWELGEALHAAQLACPDPADALPATGRAYIGWAQANRARFQLMFRTEILEPTRQDYKEASERAMQPLTHALTRASAAGLIAPERVRDTTLAAWGMVHGLTMLLFSQHVDAEGQEALIDRLTRQFSRSVLSS